MESVSSLRCLPLFAGLIFLVGCGGGGGGSLSAARSARAAVRFSVEWPERGRTVSADANSVLVAVEIDGVEVGHEILNRPAGNAAAVTDASFRDLPVGTLTTSATAYPETDAHGDAIATGHANGSLTSGETLFQKGSLPNTESNLEVVTIGYQNETGGLVVIAH